MADVKGGLPTKTIGTFQDHEVLMAKIRLGTLEKLEATAVLGGAGSSTSPVINAQATHKFLEFHLQSDPTGDYGYEKGLQINLTSNETDGLGNVAIEANMTVPTAKYCRVCSAVSGKMIIQGNARLSWCTGGNFEAQLPNATTHANLGPVYGLVSHIVFAGDGTTFAWGNPTTPCALFMGEVVGGNQAARRKVVNVLSLYGEAGTKASAYMISSEDVTGNGTAPNGTNKGIQVRVNDEQYWLAIYAI